MSNSNAAAPTVPMNAQIDWRRVVSAACLKCDWTALAKAAIGSTELATMVGEAFRMIGRSIENDIARVDAEAATSAPAAEPTAHAKVCEAEPPRVEAPTEEAAIIVVDEAVANAAALLGVAVDANADEIRAALRSRLSASGLHPDQGGDGEEAKLLIAAKNLLVERARAART
jgi:hypothetical protein